MKLHYNFDKSIGRIKPMHGVGQPPFVGARSDMFHYLSEAGIPFSRLHDVGGPFGGNLYVDISNIFRDFDADVEDPSSYDFTFTDWLISSLVEHGVEPIYRLGETIENFYYIKAYRIFPPKDFFKWARICEHIIKHYNYGWAGGFHFNIKYWEIWNEPDNGRDNTENQMWHGTKEQFYELYSVTAKHLKKTFGDEIKVGGYATCGFRHVLSDPERYGVDCERSFDTCYSHPRSRNFIDFFEGFFDYIKREGAPIDFFSWHSYLTTDRTAILAGYLHRRLNELGYPQLETQLNEWNNSCEDRGDPTVATQTAMDLRGTAMAASMALSMMCAMQGTSTALLCFYDAQVGPSYYRGMFDPSSKKPTPLYYAFKAFNELYKLGSSVECIGAADGIYTLAAEGEGSKAVVIANTSEAEQMITTDLPSGMDAFLLCDGKNLEPSRVSPNEFVLPAGSFVLFKS